jgi:hypothetical protein
MFSVSKSRRDSNSYETEWQEQFLENQPILDDDWCLKISAS